MTNKYNPLLLIMYISRNVNGCLNIDGFFLPFKLLNDFYDLKKSHVHKEGTAAQELSQPHQVHVRHSHSHHVLWLRMTVRRRPRGQWWLIFSALTDCVSNGALIAFAPPSMQTRPKKSIQIPKREVPPVGSKIGREVANISVIGEWRGIGVMCNLKSIS